MKKLHLLCNAHLDPVWQWRWDEGVGTAITTFSAAADFCEEFGDFVFCHNEAVLYQWVEENDPVLFKRIQRLVEAGKWHIMGGWYLQPDCNMTSDESFIRQIQNGLDYFKEKFPTMAKPEVAINFDSFGHTKGMVQILSDAGYKGYICTRPPLAEGDRNMVWKGYADSELIVYRVYEAYNSLLGQVEKRLEPFIAKFGDMETGLFLWGVGNHGGGPSRQDYRTIEKLKEKYPDVEIVHSTPEAYFKEIEGKKSSFADAGDLNYVHQGCFTSMVRIKQLHQKLENQLAVAEKMALHAELCGVDFDKNAFKRAEEDLMFNEFHDVLPGSCIKDAEEDAIVQLSHGIYEAEKIQMKAFFALAQGQPKAAAGEYPVLIYNPHPFKAKRTVECEFMLADQNWSQEEFYDVNVFVGDKKIPCQFEKEGSNIPLDWRKKLVFDIEMEPFSMNRVSIYTELKQVSARTDGDVKTDYVFDNGRLKAVVSAKSGLIESLSVDGKEYLKESFALKVTQGYCDPWGFDYNSRKTLIGEFKLLDEKQAQEFAAVYSDAICPVRVIEDGAVRTVIEALFGYKGSRACVRYIFPKDGTAVQIHVELLNNEKDIKLRLNYKTAFKASAMKGRTAFGLNDLLVNGDEVVAQDYIVSYDDENAVSAIHFGTYGMSANGNEVNFTLLNSSAYCAHPIYDRVIMPSDRYSSRIDQGERSYDFEFNFGGKEERFIEIEKESKIAHQKPYAISFFPTGNGEVCKEFMELEGDGVSLSAVRKAKNGKDILVRLFNSLDKQNKATVSLKFCNSKNTVEFKPYQFKSFLVKDGKWTDCNCLEEPK